MSKKKKELKPYKDKDGNIFKPHAFLVESHHPVVGRILEVDGKKYKILDDHPDPRTGTFIKPMEEEDEELIKEYEQELDWLSEKLVEKVDLKRMIMEQIKKKTPQEIKTGIFILKKEEEGEKIDVEHTRGCYHFKMIFKEQEFDFASGYNTVDDAEVLR